MNTLKISKIVQRFTDLGWFECVELGNEISLALAAEKLRNKKEKEE